MKTLEDRRSEFPSLADTVYLFNHSLGPMPRGVRESLSRYADIWSERSISAWEESWWNMNAETGNVVADIINAPHNSISMQANVTTAMAALLSCFDFDGKKNKVVYTNLHFPSLLYLL